jgi:hypothetical protein
VRKVSEEHKKQRELLYAKLYRAQHPEKVCEYSRRYRANNLEKERARQRASTAKRRRELGVPERISSPERKRELKRLRDQRTKAKYPEKVRANNKRWREANPEKARENLRKWKAENREHVKTEAREWARKNKEKINAKARAKFAQNPEMRAAHYARYRARLQNDPVFRMLTNYRRRITCALMATGSKAAFRVSKLFGCERHLLIGWLEAGFKPGMTWDNYGRHGWHVDHIRPCAAFDLSDPVQQKKCFHFTNLQPLWASENMSKGQKH